MLQLGDTCKNGHTIKSKEDLGIFRRYKDLPTMQARCKRCYNKGKNVIKGPRRHLEVGQECTRGHLITSDDDFVSEKKGTKYRSCKRCKAENQKAYRDRHGRGGSKTPVLLEKGVCNGRAGHKISSMEDLMKVCLGPRASRFVCKACRLAPDSEEPRTRLSYKALMGLSCGHGVVFLEPHPHRGDPVLCRKCDDYKEVISGERIDEPANPEPDSLENGS